MQDEKLKRLVFSVVVIVWAIAFLDDIVNPEFEVPVAVHGLVSMIIGYFVGTRYIKKQG